MDLLLGTTSGRAVLLLALLALTSLVWFVASRRSGQMRTTAHVDVIDLAALGAVPGARATFVQFSSEVCAPCRQVARVLGGLSTGADGVAHVELDVARHPELVRSHGVLRTPTVFLLGPGGTIHARTSGPMTPTQARDALAALELDLPHHGRARAVTTSKDPR